MRILEGIPTLVEGGLNPVITVTEVHDENGTVSGKERFFELLRELGIRETPTQDSSCLSHRRRSRSRRCLRELAATTRSGCSGTGLEPSTVQLVSNGDRSGRLGLSDSCQRAGGKMGSESPTRLTPYPLDHPPAGHAMSTG